MIAHARKQVILTKWIKSHTAKRTVISIIPYEYYDRNEKSHKKSNHHRHQRSQCSIRIRHENKDSKKWHDENRQTKKQAMKLFGKFVTFQ